MGGTSSFGAQLAEAQVSEQVAVYAEKAVSEFILVSCTRFSMNLSVENITSKNCKS